MKNLNWYPGHMKKTRELIEAHLKLVDVVIEVCDARIPLSSRNPVISGLAAGKRIILVLNKSDLADAEATKAWIGKFHADGSHTDSPSGNSPSGNSPHADGLYACALNSVSGQGTKSLISKLERIDAERTAPGKAKSKLPLRLMVVGIPNSGKSSLINRLVGRRAAQVGDRPGVTRGKQWLTLENGMQLLDTPGILWPKFEDPQVGLNLAFCGSIRDEIMDVSELALELLVVLIRGYSDLLEERYGIDTGSLEKRYGIDTGSLEKRYGIDTGALDEGYGDVLAAEDEGAARADMPAYMPADGTEQALTVMEEIAKRRGYILPGKRIDYERAARALLDDFRSGKLGRITLELPGKKK